MKKLAHFAKDLSEGEQVSQQCDESGACKQF